MLTFLGYVSVIFGGVSIKTTTEFFMSARKNYRKKNTDEMKSDIAFGFLFASLTSLFTLLFSKCFGYTELVILLCLFIFIILAILALLAFARIHKEKYCRRNRDNW